MSRTLAEGTATHEPEDPAMCTKAMSYTILVSLLSVLLCLSAQAQNVEVGAGIVCDTQKQMERFIVLFHEDAEAAVNAVNAEEADPKACVFGTIAYVRGPDIATARTQDATFQIVRVLVVGIFTEAGFRATVPAAFFSVEKVEERAA
jgi:citrate lyase beta subunit